MPINFCPFDGDKKIPGTNLTTIMMGGVEDHVGIRRPTTQQVEVIGIAL